MSDRNHCILIKEILAKQNDLYIGREGEKIALQVLYGIVTLLGAIENMFIIFTITSHRSLRNLRTSYIAHLACSDLVLCLLTAPSTLYVAFNGIWGFGELACKLVGSLQAVNTFVSVLTLTAIALDRYLLIAFPIGWRRPNRALYCIFAAVWLLSLLIAAPYFSALGTAELRHGIWNSSNITDLLSECGFEHPQVCGELFSGSGLFNRRTYTLAVVLCQYMLPLFAFLFVYVSIARQRLGARGRFKIRKRQHKKVFLVSALVLVFGICWLPSNLYCVLEALGVVEFNHFLYIYFHLVGMATACVNPVLYGLLNTNVRRSVSATRRSYNTDTRVRRTLENGIDSCRRRSHTVPVRKQGIQSKKTLIMVRSNPDVQTHFEMLPLNRPVSDQHLDI